MALTIVALVAGGGFALLRTGFLGGSDDAQALADVTSEPSPEWTRSDLVDPDGFMSFAPLDSEAFVALVNRGPERGTDVVKIRVDDGETECQVSLSGSSDATHSVLGVVEGVYIVIQTSDYQAKMFTTLVLDGDTGQELPGRAVERTAGSGWMGVLGRGASLIRFDETSVSRVDVHDVAGPPLWTKSMALGLDYSWQYQMGVRRSLHGARRWPS